MGAVQTPEDCPLPLDEITTELCRLAGDLAARFTGVATVTHEGGEDSGVVEGADVVPAAQGAVRVWCMHSAEDIIVGLGDAPGWELPRTAASVEVVRAIVRTAPRRPRMVQHSGSYGRTVRCTGSPTGPVPHIDGVAGAERPGSLPKELMDVRWRGRPRQVPHASEGIGERQPDEALTVLEGVDLVCERRRYDDVVGDDAARLVAATEGVREAQGHMRAGASADCQLALSSRERAIVDRERVGVSPVEEESKTPGAPARGPDEPHLRLLTRRSSLTPWSRSSQNCVKVALR